MKIKDMLSVILDELQKNTINDFPFNMLTSKNGDSYIFTSEAMDHFYKLSKVIYENDSDFKTIELENFIKVVQQCVIDMFSENGFNDFEQNSITIISKLKKNIKETTINKLTTYTHYIPVLTLGMETIETLKLGSVAVMSLEQWIETINLSGRECFDNYDWKNYLKDKLGKKEILEIPSEPCSWMLEIICDAVENSSAIIKVTIENYEKDFSYKLANIVAKTTLDSISLLFNADVFYQQVLTSERMVPFRIHRIIETSGNLWLPGSSLSKRVSRISSKKAYEEIMKNENKIILSEVRKILYALSNPTEARYPNLSSRWATALDWYAEGIREQNDAIALTKIATALDVLSNGGKYNGILEMLKNILELSEDDVILKNRIKTITLKEFVKEIYDYGRSKILHGTHHERLESFYEQRVQATIITKTVLIGCLILLSKYTEGDLIGGFRELSTKV